MVVSAACSHAAATGRSPAASVEVADVFRRFGPAYRRDHRLSLPELKVMDAIVHCRTAHLGGHKQTCAQCGFRRLAYNSCRNRHCPKCQALTRARWLADRKAELLAVPYFHGVFTLPHELNPLMLWNKPELLGLLFEATRETLKSFGRNNLGGKIGFTLILHTWDQKLNLHPHLHAVIAGGALAEEGNRWIASDEKFLFCVHAMSQVFRGKFIDWLKRRHARGELTLPPDMAAAPRQWTDLIDRLYQKSWVVYAKPPFGGPEQVLEYLGRYTHRVAISNHRVLAIEDDQVVFSYRDRRDGNTRKTMSLDGTEFIRRFLRHVVPPRFMRIRHYGLIANASKATDLARCRDLLGMSDPQPTPAPSVAEWMLALTGEDITRCPRCQGPLDEHEIPPTRRPFVRRHSPIAPRAP